MAAVTYQQRDRVGIVTIDRPAARNALSPEVVVLLDRYFEQARSDDSVRVVVLTGAGDKRFCAGADFKPTPAPTDAKDGYQAPQERSYAMYAPFLSLLEIEVPVIAAMQGHAIGGGLGLAVVCDLRVANREARYGANFVRLGLHPGMSTTYLLPRLMGVPRAVEFLLTGRIVSGAEAAEAGLVHYAEAPDDVLPRALALAEEIRSAAPLAVRWTKRSIYQGLTWDPAGAARHEALVQSRSMETEDFQEGVAALLGRREPDFRGR